MHAFLFIGGSINLEKEIKSFEKKNNFDFVFRRNIKKVEEIRDLIKETNLKFNKKTLYILEDFDQASEIAQNAFLKKLEEPGDNLFFLLTAKTQNILPTIVSRCEVKDILTKKQDRSSIILSGKLVEDLKTIDTIKTREEAKNFLDEQLSSELINKNFLSKILEAKIKLEANANFGLQLTSLIIDLKKIA